MPMMRFFCFVFGVLAVSSCRSNKLAGDGLIDTAGGTGADEDGAVGDDSADDTDVSDGFPVGRWKDCRGTVEILESGEWTWLDAESGCDASGTVYAEEDVVVFQAARATACGESLPWWLPQEGADELRYHHTGNESRLSLVPELATGSTDSSRHDVKHLYVHLERARWLLENQDGDQSHFDACYTPEGVFFEGGYRTIDGSCDFLSCGGAISEWRISAESVNIWTTCAGDCPCAGVVVGTSHTDTEMSGNYAGANCAIVTSGDFTGVRVDFPGLDE
jgi:hypothetical protein